MINKNIFLVLTLTFFSCSLFAQSSKEERLNGMYNTIKANDYKTLVNNYIYADFFEIISKDSLENSFQNFYQSDAYTIQLLSYSTRKPSKVVEMDQVKYFKTFVDKKYKITLSRDSYVKDSISRASYYDSLQTEMEKDTAYQNRLAVDTLDMSWIYDFPYWELEDYQYSYLESVDNLMYTDLMYMEDSYRSNFGKKIELELDYGTFSMYFSDIDHSGTIGILNTANTNEWQFLGYLDSYYEYLKFLLPVKVQKQLKLKF